MAAIIRVKRRLDEDPAESLIIQYKKRKIDGGKTATEKPEQLCLSLVTTVKSKDAALSRPLQKTLRRQQLQTDYKSHESKRISQARAENSAKSKANRYRIVNSRRALSTNSADLDEAGADSPVQTAEKETLEQVAGEVDKVPSSDLDTGTSESSPESVGACSEADDPVIHDVEIDCDSVQEGVQVPAPSSGSGITLNGQALVSRPVLPAAEGTYVYDLYYMNSKSQQYDFRDIENILSIEAIHDTLVADADRSEECGDMYEDEDDSNDENNWRNDYPDKDPDASDSHSDVELDDDFLEGEVSRSYRDTLNDDILVQAVGTKLQLFGSDSSSGSGGDDEDAYEDDEDKGSRSRHVRPSYEAYMSRVKQELNGELSDSENDD